ncbi:MAG: nucleotidyltransferase family protein [Clostridia bacterium]|nr:nucleotidyltransferase family protein [Clostridia bacterium]
MKTVAIICEYNPFHLGHLHQINEVRKSGADCIIGIMSGNYTQRGEVAVIPKHERALSAVRSGVDLVVELPFPYCIGYAEAFAMGGVSVAKGLGVDSICFGSESADLDALKSLAKCSFDDGFLARYKEYRTEEMRGSASYFEALKDYAAIGNEIRSNDILGMHYIRAAIKLGYSVDFTAIQRIGGKYRSLDVSEEIASASAIRRVLREGGSINGLLPSESLEALRDCVDRRLAPCFNISLEGHILAFFRTVSPSSLSGIADLPTGFEHRLCAAAHEATCIDGFIEALVNRDFSEARVWRIIFYCLLGICREYLDIECNSISYVNLLAANRVGCEYLARIRKSGFVATKVKDIMQLGDAARKQYELSRRADALYTLALPEWRESSYFVKKAPYVV